MINTPPGDDRVFGGAGNDTIDAGKGNDSVRGGAGDDTLDGGAGDDTLDGGLGRNTIDGGDGTDWVGFGGALDGVAVYLSDTGIGTAFHKGGRGVDIIRGVENVTGTSSSTGGTGADNIVGNSAANVINTLSGDDRVFGGAGNDTIEAGKGNDSVRGGAGDDTLDGGAGDDTLDGGIGRNTIDGGSEIDTVTYFNTVPVPVLGVSVDLADGRASGTSLQSKSVFMDTLRDIENVIGTSSSSGGRGRDFIAGSEQDNRLEGLSGDDFLLGRGGNDTLLGGSGADLLAGGAGENRIFGGSGTDTVLFPLAAVDLTQGVAVDLGANRAHDKQTGGLLRLDHIFEVENVRGTEFADKIVGGPGENRLTGNQGDDILTGGDGKDTFDYLVQKDRPGGSFADGRDTITDFVRADDFLELRFYFEPLLGKAKPFTFASLDSNGNSAIDGGDYVVEELKDGDGNSIGLRVDMGLATDALVDDATLKIGAGVATIEVIGPTELVDAGIVADNTVYLI
ncbi:MAG: calcium-binding protein [Rhodospirillales bacterium]|nr:calcium-binding protein [Rhodospirillales bacterium]